MQVVALYDQHHGLRDQAEIIHRGTEFRAPGTGIMNSDEHGRSLIRSGACCAVADWPKLAAKTQPGYDWATAQKEAAGAQ
jgi:hypothetical protein